MAVHRVYEEQLEQALSNPYRVIPNRRSQAPRISSSARITMARASRRPSFRPSLRPSGFR